MKDHLLRILWVPLILSTLALPAAADLHITEFLADNARVITDEDGDNSDYIELFNFSADPVNLNGYYLTDDAGDLSKFRLPAVTLGANEFLLVFASAKDRAVAGSELHANFSLNNLGEYLALVDPDGVTVVQDFAPAYPEQFEDASYGLMQTGDTTTSVLLSSGAACRWLVPGSDLGETWTNQGFDDSAWEAATTGIGYEEGSGYQNLFGTNGDVEAEMADITSTVYIRLPFEVVDVDSVAELTLKMKYDDGFIAYLNGVRVAGGNDPALSTFDSTATTDNPDGNATVFEDFDLTAAINLLQEGTNLLAIHGLNGDNGSSDLLQIPEIHALRLSNPAVGDPGYLSVPSPGSFNGETFGGFVSDTNFSVDRGFFDAPFTVEITSATPDAQIRYTTNGNDPSASSGSLYTGPINISRTTTLKAIAFKENSVPTNVDCQTYIFLTDVLQQPSNPPGFPPGVDYGMDSDVVNNPTYSGAIRNDLKSIPSISIAMNVDELFGGGGIYQNANSSGVAWERAGSMEVIFPDGKPGTQANCGVRMQGGVGRNSSFPKHSFRLLFKKEYGDTKLRYPLFQDALEDSEGATDKFDTIILRSGFNNTWHRGSGSEENRAQYLRDQFMHDSQLAMGHASCHGSFFHLYLNGLYWGVYNVLERPNADFASSYHGGKKEEWDALNSYPRNVVDGEPNAWITAHNIANSGVSTQAGYDALSEYVDIPNLIDYMLLNFYGGNLDWDDHNWYAARRRLPGEGYKFFSWDAERTLESTNGDNRTGVGQSDKPSRLYSQLRANAEFRMQFADHAHKHLFNGGALTPARTVARYQALADYIDRAIVGESARWGDSKRSNPYTRNVEWVNERNRLLNSHLPQRTNVLLGQLRGANLYPDTDAPEFGQHGGHVSSTTVLTMDSTSGTMYYTTDGSDPRLPGGGINPAAIQYDGSIAPTTVVPRESTWKYLDDGSNQGTAWREPGFDDTNWESGPAELGYGDGGEATAVDFGGDFANKHVTTYFRHTFNLVGASNIASLAVELQRDDGAVVYLNGNEVMRSNMPGGTVTFQTLAASEVVGSSNETQLHSRAVAPSHLVQGENVLAVELHQASPTSSDISFDLRLHGTQVNTLNALFMTETGFLRARALDGGEWSAMNEAFFIVDAEVASDQNLVISEIHYRPAGSNPVEEAAGHVERSQFEYLELENIGGSDVDLTNVRFADGVTFNFNDSEQGVILGVGERVLLVNHREAFEARYPSVPASQIADEFSGNLSNDGERIVLLAGDGSVIRDMTYNDQSPWPESADGDGLSLVLIAPASNPDHADPHSWRPSVAPGGSPGASDAVLFAGGKPGEDIDGDTLGAWTEHALGTSDTDASDQALPSANLESIDLGKAGGVRDFLTLSFTRNLAADDVIYVVEVSGDLGLWRSGAGEVEFFGRTNNGDGTTTEVYRAAAPIGTGDTQFMRLRLTER